jgi:hypothetical protein
MCSESYSQEDTKQMHIAADLAATMSRAISPLVNEKSRPDNHGLPPPLDIST